MKPNQYTKFKISKPWGYYPPDVEKVIDQYEEIIGKLNAKLSEKIEQGLRYQERIDYLQERLKILNIQMRSLELPDTEELVESVVLNDFKSYPNGQETCFTIEKNKTDEGKPFDESEIIEPIIEDEDELDFKNRKKFEGLTEGSNDDKENTFKIVT